MRIEAELAKFDGKNAALLRQISERHRPSAVTIRKLISLAGTNSGDLQIGATKLLKSWYAQGLRFTRAQCSALVRLFGKKIRSESHLRALQMLSAIEIPKNQKTSLYRILMSDLTHSK